MSNVKLPKNKALTTKPKTFIYKGINRQGKKVVGEIDAINVATARIKLYKDGIIARTISQKRALAWQKSIKSIDITLFFRQLATMLSAGIVLTQALAISEQNSQNPLLKTIIANIKADIESGQNFATAIAKHRAFSRLSVALIDAGERSGSLDTMLDRIAAHQESLEILKSKLKKALQYPALVLITALIVVVILLVKVVPIFAKTFADLGGQLPLPTRVIMAMSDGLVAHFWVLSCLILAAIIGALYLHKKTDKVSQFVDDISLKLPLIKTLTQKTAAARFSRTLATTFGAGIPLLSALELSATATNHRAFIKELHSVGDKVRGGQKLSQAMSGSALFLPMTVQMIDVGEESGRLTAMLEKVAEYYDNEVSEQIDGLTSLIEPTIIVILGVIVGGVVLAMYLPIFQMGMNTP